MTSQEAKAELVSLFVYLQNARSFHELGFRASVERVLERWERVLAEWEIPEQVNPNKKEV